MTIDFQREVIDLPKRIRAARRAGMTVSNDGFIATPDGPVHIDDLSPCTVAKIVKPVRLPWRIVIDTAEQAPFSFTGIRADAARQNRMIEVETVRRCLGRYPDSYGDYSLEPITCTDESMGMAAVWRRWCYVERKSLEDCQSTLLGFADGHRERFESELSNLAAVIRAGGAALVVVECDLAELLNTAPAGTTKSPQTNAKGLHRSVVSCWREYGVPWAFCGGRRLAEITTFRFLESFWKHRGKGKTA
jgi:hypothetical protein